MFNHVLVFHLADNTAVAYLRINFKTFFSDVLECEGARDCVRIRVVMGKDQ